ncbi:MAG: glycosyltransferase family 39 protein, partial [Deltaproteobacteria bacterium]
MKLRVRHQIFFLAAIVLVIYYPALSAGVNSVDDSRIVAAYGMGAGKGLAEIFLSSGNYYYRPLVALSYYLDNLLWCMHPRFMHLENILYHLLNTLLLFFIARQLAGAWGVKSPWFPLASALLFAVHPINTESVTWIAGRTDPLAAIFIFSAIWCLLQCLIKGRLQYLYPVLLLFILGVLTKEIAFCFLPVALLLAISWPGEVRIRPTLLRLLAGLSVSVLLLVLVFITFSRTFSVTAFLSSSRGGVLLSVQNALMALGFYLKKLIFPLPLNFAIDAVSSFYILPGVLFVLLWPFCLKMRTLLPLLAVVCGVFLFPSLLVS